MDYSSSPYDEVFAGPLLFALWARRRVLVRLLSVCAAVISAAAILVVVLTPTERIGTLRFRALFDGASRGEYPNGTRFSPADVVALPVLADVYRANHLEPYLDLAQLKNALFVLQANAELEMLSYEYQAKLADPKLSSTERSKLEEEFKRKRDTVSSAEFSVSMRRSESLQRMPRTLTAKIMADTLEVWARQSRDQRGALKYDVPMLSRNILQRDRIMPEDYLVSVDILRVKALGIEQNIDGLLRIPGAAVVRTGATSLTLSDVRSNVEDVLRFDLEPAAGVIAARHLSRNTEDARTYVGEQLRQAERARDELLQRVSAIQEPFRAYLRRQGDAAAGSGNAAPAPLRSGEVIPQLSESFLQQLIDISTENLDTHYRQDLTDRMIREGVALASTDKERRYYESLSRALVGWHGTGDLSHANAVQRRIDHAFTSLAASLDAIAAIYEQISQRNLTPATELYAVTVPYAEVSEPSVPRIRVVVFAGLAFAACALLVIATLILQELVLRQPRMPPAR